MILVPVRFFQRRLLLEQIRKGFRTVFQRIRHCVATDEPAFGQLLEIVGVITETIGILCVPLLGKVLPVGFITYRCIYSVAPSVISNEVRNPFLFA